MTVLFSEGFESGDFRGWSFVQALDPKQGPGPTVNKVGTASTLGVRPRSGTYAAQFERPTWATTLPHAKVFKEWSNIGKRDEFGRTINALPNGGDPSGTYRAWFYLPTTYKADSSWMNIFQFKEQGYKNGSWHQDPSWWLNVAKASKWGMGGDEPVIFANHWNNSWNYTPKAMKVPLGRWFEIRADLYEKDRIEWYVDGQLLDVSRNSKYPVGRFFDKSDGWVFGVGHYQGYGRLYVDDASMATLGTVTPPPSPTPAPSPTPTSGPDTILLRMSGDQYNGSPRYNLLVDGVKIAEGYASANHRTGQWQEVSIKADLSKAKTIAVRFDNDLYGGSSLKDRNLWVDSIKVNGTTIQAEKGTVKLDNGATLTGTEVIKGNGTLSVGLPAGIAKDTVTLWVAGDMYQGAPHFDLLVNGQQVAEGTATLARSTGGWQQLTFKTDLSAAKTIGVRFDNDLYGGTSGTDRNLWIDKIALNGSVYQAEDGMLNGMRLGREVLKANGTLAFDLAATPRTAITV